MDKTIKNSHIGFLDLLNICACLAVILMHVNGAAYWHFDDSYTWKSGVVLGVLSTWAVPVFFMITGANLINYDAKYTTKIYFKKRFYKTVIPFLLWSIVPLLIWIYRGKLGDHITVYQIVDYIMNAKINETYWFFLPLFSAYLCIPVFTAIEKTRQKNIFKWLIVYAFVTITFFPVLARLIHGQMNWNGLLSAPIMGGFLLYVVMGYLLTHCWVLSFKKRLLIYMAGILGAGMKVYSGIYWSLAEGAINRELEGIMDFPCVFLSAAVFVFFQYEIFPITQKREKWQYYITYLSSFSFGVYLMHMWIVKNLPHDLLVAHFNSVPWRIISTLIVYAVCILLTVIIKKVPGLKRIIP